MAICPLPSDGVASGPAVSNSCSRIGICTIMEMMCECRLHLETARRCSGPNVSLAKPGQRSSEFPSPRAQPASHSQTHSSTANQLATQMSRQASTNPGSSSVQAISRGRYGRSDGRSGSVRQVTRGAGTSPPGRLRKFRGVSTVIFMTSSVPVARDLHSGTNG